VLLELSVIGFPVHTVPIITVNESQWMASFFRGGGGGRRGSPPVQPEAKKKGWHVGRRRLLEHGNTVAGVATIIIR